MNHHDEYTDSPPPRRSHSAFSCPFCGSEAIPAARKKVSALGWVSIIILLLVCTLLLTFFGVVAGCLAFPLVGLFPIVLIPYFFLTEEEIRCADCGHRVGR